LYRLRRIAVLRVFSRTRRRPVVRQPRFSRLEVDRLEDRSAPSTLDPTALLVPPPDTPTDTTTVATSVADPAASDPVSVQPVPADAATRSGTSTDAAPADPTPVAVAMPVAVGVAVAGPASPAAPTPADPAAPTPSGPGGQADAPSAPPIITSFEPHAADHCQWTLVGQVTDPANNVGGLSVTIQGDGLPDGQAVVSVTPDAGSSSTGSFDVTVELKTNTTHFAVMHVYTAVASDGHGRVSLPMECEITQAGQPPQPS
jgi:hypothetical protein